jgi:hypothetical protein
MAEKICTKKGALKDLEELTLFGKTILLSKEVRYLGLMLDKRFMWGAQLDKVKNRAFWTSRGSFRKTTRPESKVVHWLHTIVIRP